MKNRQNTGFDEHYNAQVAVTETTRLIVGTSLSNHPNDQAEVAPTLDSIPPALGTPAAAALDNGFFSAKNIATLEGRGIGAYIATGQHIHYRSWQERFAGEPVIGIIKEVLGFCQFSLRGEVAAPGEWSLVCLAYTLNRLHTLTSW